MNSHSGGRWLRAGSAAVLSAAAALAACRTAPRQACEPERGTEAWVERHYASPRLPKPDSVMRLFVDFTADAGGLRPPAQSGFVSVVGPAGAARSETLQVAVPDRGPVAFRLTRPGRYAVRIRAISFAGIDRSLTVASGEEVYVDVQMRRPAYCAQIVTVSVR